LLIVGLAAGEWFIRKRKGLAWTRSACSEDLWVGRATLRTML